MEIILANCNDDPAVLRKNLQNLITIQCEFYGDFSKESPSIVLDRTWEKDNRNYIFIPIYNRYYYISDHTIEDGHKLVLQLQEDYLMSFQNQILNSQIIADRSSSAWEPYIVDNTIQDSGRIRIYQRKLNKIFTNSANNNYVLMVGG